MAWDPTPFIAPLDDNATAFAFYTDWAVRQYGVSAGATAEQVATLWMRYFAIPLIQGYGHGGNADTMPVRAVRTKTCVCIIFTRRYDPPLSSTSMITYTVAPRLQANQMQWLSPTATSDYAAIGNVSQSTIVAAAAARNVTAASQAALAQLAADASALTPSIPGNRRGFYVSHIVLQSSLLSAAVDAALGVCDAIDAIASGNIEVAMTALDNSLGRMDDAFAAMRAAEGTGRWHGLYAADRLSYMQRGRSAVRAFRLGLAMPGQQAVNATVLEPSYYKFYDYQLPFAANFPRNSYDPAWNLASYVRVNCAVLNMTSGACVNTPDGGHFRGCNAPLTMDVMDSDAVIRYTIDGATELTATSGTLYSAPINVAALGSAVTLRSAAFYAGDTKPRGATTVSVYTQWPGDDAWSCAPSVPAQTLGPAGIAGAAVGAVVGACIIIIAGYRLSRQRFTVSTERDSLLRN